MKNLTLLIALFIYSQSFAQNENSNDSSKTFEGRVEYELIFEDLSKEAKDYSSYMPSKMTIEIEASKARIVMGEKMEVNNVVITDLETNTTLTLTTHMETKIAVIDKRDEEELNNIEIEYIDESKIIAGYKCFKAKTNIDDNEVIYYYTQDLPSIKTNFVSNLKGYPMEIMVKTKDYTMIQRAVVVKEYDVDEISLDIPEDYTPMTPKQMSKAYGIGM